MYVHICTHLCIHICTHQKKKARNHGKRAFNENVRRLASWVKKRDPRQVIFFWKKIPTAMSADIYQKPTLDKWISNSLFESLYMGWLRLVGSLKLQVSFAKYRLFYRALLQKRPMILRSILIVATP